MAQKRTFLITGCSQGGLGDALAQAIHKRGHRVIATARDPNRMAHFQALGIETLVLDVLSQESIAACVTATAEKTHGALDGLINNAGSGYSIPLADADLQKARKVFDVNVWAVLAVIQAFIPLLMKSTQGPIIANNTSVGSVVPAPMAGIYNASKAATAMLTENLRHELSPFNIRVVDLKTGVVKSSFFRNQVGGPKPSLPKGSIYMPAKDEIEGVLSGSAVDGMSMDSHKWAQEVVALLLGGLSPPVQIWKGTSAFPIWFVRRFLPFTFMDRPLLKKGALDVLKKRLRAPPSD